MVKSSLSSWHVSVAAEAIAAALFARCGLDVSVQYGANQPEYDLMVANGESLLKISVKGSQDGSWGLTQSLLKNADYHAAIDAWLARHKPRTVFCLVQFKDVAFDEMPRIYLATPEEIAARMKETANGRGDSILYENHIWTTRSKTAAGQTEQIPPHWKFTPKRVTELLEKENWRRD